MADASGNFDWAAPEDEVHSFVNDLERPIGTYLYGRAMYEVMVYWETFPIDAAQPQVHRDYAQIWQSADKVVYSSHLDIVASAKTRIERSFDPDAVSRMKATATRDITVGGPDLAAQAIRAGLVDEFQFFVSPVVVGGGNKSLPAMFACRANWWTNAVSATAWCTSATASTGEATMLPHPAR